MTTRSEALECVLTTLEMALDERLTYPSVTVEPGFIPRIAQRLERVAHDASLGELADIKQKRIGGRIIYDIANTGTKTSSESATFDTYLGLVAQFLVHISPAFYTGRHSFTFRDRIVSEQLEEVADLDVALIWPEMFDNLYLTKAELDEILMTRQVEVSIALKGLQSLISRCCGSEQKCSPDERLRALRTGGFFEEGSEFSESLQYVCYGKGRGCWQEGSNKIILPCEDADAACPVVPEEAKKIGSQVGGPKYFSTCSTYESFLRSFASEAMSGEVNDPFLKIERMSTDATKQVRSRWRKELKMMRLYLDANLSD